MTSEECWFLEEGSDLAILKSEGMQKVVRDELMREVRNGRRSPEMVWRREEGNGYKEKPKGF